MVVDNQTDWHLVSGVDLEEEIRSCSSVITEEENNRPCIAVIYIGTDHYHYTVCSLNYTVESYMETAVKFNKRKHNTHMSLCK